MLIGLLDQQGGGGGGAEERQLVHQDAIRDGGVFGMVGARFRRRAPVEFAQQGGGGFEEFLVGWDPRGGRKRGECGPHLRRRGTLARPILAGGRINMAPAPGRRAHAGASHGGGHGPRGRGIGPAARRDRLK